MRVFVVYGSHLEVLWRIIEKISFFLRLILHGIDTAQKLSKYKVFSGLHFPHLKN